MEQSLGTTTAEGYGTKLGILIRLPKGCLQLRFQSAAAIISLRL